MKKLFYTDNKQKFINLTKKLYSNQNKNDQQLFGEIEPEDFYQGLMIINKDDPIGVVIISGIKSFYKPQILVDSNYRRLGIAEGLFKELLKNIDLPDSTILYYNYYPENYKSEALSKKLGFDKYLIRSRQSLKKLKFLNK